MTDSNAINEARRRIATLRAAKEATPKKTDRIILSAQVDDALAPLVRDTLKGQDRGAQTILVNQALAAYYNVDVAK